MMTYFTQQSEFSDLFISTLIPANFTRRQTIKIFSDVEIPRIDLNSIFISSNIPNIYAPSTSKSFETMIASEKVLSRDWNEPDEDEAWASL